MALYENLEQKLEYAKGAPEFSEYIASLKEYFEQNCGKEIKRIDYDLFMQFYTSGSRKEYDALNAYSRTRLSCAAMLYLLFREQKYMDEVCNMVWSICGEINWAIAAHLSGRPVENYRTEIDLLAASTASELAEIYYLLREDLPERIRELIEVELKTRIFDGFESRTFWWETVKNNWAAVCGGNVGVAYMLMAPQRFQKVRDRLLKAVDSFLQSYEEDGCCKEGVGYWRYGFSAYIYFADCLYHFSNGKYDIRHSEKIDKIATYLQKVMLRNGIPASFSDSARSYQLNNVGLISYFYDHYKGYAVPNFSMGSFLSGGDEVRFDALLRKFMWWNPEIQNRVSKLNLGWNYFENAEWYIHRKEQYSFAAKGGHNDEPHNHNDVGSFIFATDKGQILADIGSMEYTKDTFSPRRYEFLQNSSRGHSLPIVDGIEQKAGREYHGRILSCGEDGFSLEVDGAYEGNVGKITRTFTLLADGMILTDHFDDLNGKPVTERLITVIEPQLRGDCVVIADAEIKAHTMPTVSSCVMMNRQVKPETIYIMDYPLRGEEFKLEVRVKKGESYV